MAAKKQISEQPAKTPLKHLERVLPWILIVGGLVGLLASFILAIDDLDLLKNPSFQPNCNLNPIISCGSVMHTHQATVFGFPNPWVGMLTFPALIVIGICLLAGAKFKRWFWLGLEAGILFGAVFAYWMMYQSVYLINALCPYCLATDVAVTTIAWYITVYVLEKRLVPVHSKLYPIAHHAKRHHVDLLLVWFLAVIVIILKHFWYYYSKHLGF